MLGISSEPGTDHLTQSPLVDRIHRFIVDTTLSTVVDGFEATGAVLIGQAMDDPDGLPTVAVRLPPNCDLSSPLIFELYARLGRALSADDSEVAADKTVEWQETLGGYWALFYRMPFKGTVTVAAAFRAEKFSDAERHSLGTMLGSVTGVLEGGVEEDEKRQRIRSGLSVTVRGDSMGPNQIVTAVVEISAPAAGIEVGGSINEGRACSREPVEAVANAAAAAYHAPREIVFVGSSEIDAHTVTLAMTSGANSGPRLGIAVHRHGDLTGVAEAVLVACDS